jgi:hypothetical protein
MIGLVMKKGFHHTFRLFYTCGENLFVKERFAHVIRVTAVIVVVYL